ncbi:hypothetical protein ABMA27_009056 [Loxostege sticticalis]|uniref:Gustatory receptor n=1 Tax=Loxostege sticticalis TaxID=481309 RepID=A0ABR3H9T5_LOXSC
MTIAQSTILTVLLSIELFENKNNKTVFTYSAFLLDVLVFYAFTLTLVVVKNTFHDFQTDLHSFDAEIEVDSSDCKVDYMILSCFSILFLYRFVTILISCFLFNFLVGCEFDMYAMVIYSNMLIGSDTVLVVYAFVFYSAYLRLKNFTFFVNGLGVDVVSCQYLYKSVADMIEKVKKSFDVVLILTLLANTTDVIIHVYLPFANQPFKSVVEFDLTLAYVVVVQQLLILFFPALTAGMLTGQVDKLKLVLCDMLIKDKARTKDIKRFMAYIDGRPLRFKVWRVVPLDWRLPVIVLNVAVTYLIVMIQFTQND